MSPDLVESDTKVGTVIGFPHGSLTSKVKAFEAGDLQRVAELETEIWLVGRDRERADVSEDLFDLAVEMDLTPLATEEKREELRNDEQQETLPDIDVPCLVIMITGVSFRFSFLASRNSSPVIPGMR